MYTEILRIIEGGLNKDTKKVLNYSKMLAEKLDGDGDQNWLSLFLRLLIKVRRQQLQWMSYLLRLLIKKAG